jgi:SAM-dependent methyltransferase
MATDSKERFSARVDAYVAARPRYPKEIIPYLARTIGLTPAWQIVDIGAGTGISCELFLENGNPVTAVEPNAAMRQAAEKSLRGFAKGSATFNAIEGSAEATHLPTASFDLALAAQAFHWFDIAKTRTEFRRILRPTGYALLMWNDRKLTGTPFLDGYESLLNTFGTDYLRVRHNNIAPEHFAAFFGTPAYATATFPNHQHLDRAGLRARVCSSSYTPPPGHPGYAPMLTALDDLFDRTNQSGQVTIEYETELFFSRMI